MKSRVPRCAITSRLFEAAGMLEVELLQRLPGREPGRPDPPLAAVVHPGPTSTLQARGQELLVRPILAPGPVGQPVDRVPQRRRFQRPGQESDLVDRVSRPGGLVGAASGRTGSPAVSDGPVLVLNTQGGVVVVQASDLHVGFGDRQGPVRSRCAAAVGRNVVLGRVRLSTPGPAPGRGRRPTGPSHQARTRSRSATTSTRRPITDGVPDAE